MFDVAELCPVIGGQVVPAPSDHVVETPAEPALGRDRDIDGMGEPALGLPALGLVAAMRGHGASLGRAAGSVNV